MTACHMFLCLCVHLFSVPHPCTSSGLYRYPCYFECYFVSKSMGALPRGDCQAPPAAGVAFSRLLHQPRVRPRLLRFKAGPRSQPCAVLYCAVRACVFRARVVRTVLVPSPRSLILPFRPCHHLSIPWAPSPAAQGRWPPRTLPLLFRPGPLGGPLRVL